MKITVESMQQQGHPKEPEPQKEPAPQRGELEKLKSMSWKGRAWYIWAYYKVHMFLAIMAILLIHVAITSLYRHTFDTAMHCIIINSRGSEVDLSLLDEDFAQYLNLGKKQLVTAETSYIAYGDDANELSYATMAKISALVFSKDLDVIIGDAATIDHFASLNGYIDLETGLSPELLPLVQGRLFYAPGEDMVERAYAIDISNTDFAANAHLGQTPPLLGIISNSQRREYTDALIRYIFAP